MVDYHKGVEKPSCRAVTSQRDCGPRHNPQLVLARRAVKTKEIVPGQSRLLSVSSVAESRSAIVIVVLIRYLVLNE